MIVVADTSPLHYLVHINEIELLPFLFGKVLIPHAVLEELTHEGTPVRTKEWAANYLPGLRCGR